MKLPQYDNRPPPGTPLYSNPNEGKGNFLIPFGIFGLVVFWVGFIGLVIWGVFQLFS